MRAVVMAAAGGLGLAGLIAACAPEQRAASAQDDYMALCADCHGPAGKGDGPAAADAGATPADLTRIAARNGGSFPRAQVMSRIYGYTMGRGEDPMPSFGDLLDGPTVLYDAGDGLQTPTPRRLVALSEYLEGLQQ